MGLVPRVRVNPIGIDIEVEPGESLMEAAERQGYDWPTICGGVGMCTMCWVRIGAGEENAEPMEQLERDALETYRWNDGKLEPGVRLGCQLRMTGDATVYKRGVNIAGRAGTYR
jgi:ferredoxin